MVRIMQTQRRGRSKKRKSLTGLEGKAVIAPRSLWSDLPLPAGERGWRGTVGKRKDATHHFVTFPDDSQRYFFLTKDVEKWVVDSPSTGAAGAGSSRAAAAAAAPSGSPTKRGAKAAAELATPGKANPNASPGKKAKAAGAPELWAASPKTHPTPTHPSTCRPPADDSAVVLARLRDGVDGVLDKLHLNAMQDAYEAVLQVQKKHKL
ncbi:hypothetical protein ABPG77_005533 [Micractinium sp. CCAP 211/92]